MIRPVLTKVRVVSYNVLSSQLANPSSYPSYPVEHLEAPQRLCKVLQKLEHEITSVGDTASPRPTIFCLQEVSYDWAGALHTFFAQHKYHVVTGLYGKKFNGYMGILTAYPIDQLDTVHVDICRLSDTYSEWPVPMEESTLRRFSQGLRQTFQYFGLLPTPKESHWKSAERRNNVLISIVLKDKISQQEFVIGNYHMPCVYYDEKVMVLHSDLCLAHIQKVATISVTEETNEPKVDVNESSSTEPPIVVRRPYILAGDFNIKPPDAAYRLLTTGVIDPADPARPTEAPWKPQQQEPVRSAYAVAQEGQEPDCTNYSQFGDQEPFIDTLDYIFIAPSHIQVAAVLVLPPRDDIEGPLPNGQEPSDHLLIAANLDITADDET